MVSDGAAMTPMRDHINNIIALLQCGNHRMLLDDELDPRVSSSNFGPDVAVEVSRLLSIAVTAGEASAVGYQHTLDTAMFITPEEYADTKNRNNFRPVFAAPPAQEAGAVAWRTGDDEGGWAYTRDREEAEHWFAGGEITEPLYTFSPAPAQEAVERTTWRYETEAEHAARDMREGRFPGRSAVEMVPAPAQETGAHPDDIAVDRRGEWAEEIMAKLSPPLRPEIVRAALSGYRIIATAPEDLEKAARKQYEHYVKDVRDLEPAWEDLPQYPRDRLVDSLRAALNTLKGGKDG